MANFSYIKTLVIFRLLGVFWTGFWPVVALETFFACFSTFYLFTQTEDFAKTIAHALSQIFPVLKHLLFFKY